MKSFCSKIMLFGEYSVIKNGMALLIPYEHYCGNLCFRKDGKKTQDSELKSFVQYLKDKKNKGELNFTIDCEQLEDDVERGLIFDSGIPQGFGVGSSGALCAAIYDYYVGEHNSEHDKCDGDILELKKRFAFLESHFHGKSSGVDPLISFLKCPILVKSKDKIEQVEIPKYDSGGGAIFLLNTERPRRTEPLVNLFLEKCLQENFNILCENELLPITNKCIENFLEGDLKLLFDNCSTLSEFQFNHFIPMIPTLFRDMWIHGLNTQDYILKLCGAGGGGFILGITHDFERTANILKDVEMFPLFRF